MLRLRLVPEVPPSPHRAVGFLEGEPELNAGAEFDYLNAKGAKVVKRLKHAMGLWIMGKHDTPGKFHRFKSYGDKFRDCFVFEDLPEGIRLYGFTVHPLPKTDRSFELCVLTSCTTKNQDHTDQNELKKAERWRMNLGTWNAIKTFYPDTKNIDTHTHE